VSDTEDADLRKWLRHKGDRWRPVKTVRERVTFSVATLGVNEPRACDVVFARNVWRHMRSDAQERAAAELAQMLGPRGRFVVGGADLFNAALNDATPPALRRHFIVSAEHDAIWRPRLVTLYSSPFGLVLTDPRRLEPPLAVRPASRTMPTMDHV